MTMVMPELWSKSSSYIAAETNSHLKKYKHLIQWKREESILEFGFANGTNSVQTLGPLLPPDYKEYVATDISEHMIEYARKYCEIRDAKYIQMDITSTIPEEFQGRFNHVFGFVVIHMVKNPRAAFRNIYNMLKPGGQTFLTFFEQIPCDDIFDRLTRHPKWSKYGQDDMISPHFYNKNRQEEYKKHLDAAGFKNYTFEVENGSYTFSSEEECNNILISVNSTIPKIPKEEYAEYIKSFFEERDKAELFEITEENGKKTFSVHFHFFVVIASRPLTEK